MPRQSIKGFDYRSNKPVEKSGKEWRKEVKSAIEAGGKRRVENGETFITLPVVQDLGAPFFKRTTQILAIEIYANIP